MNTSKDKNDKQYCCSNPSCLHVFSEPLEIKQYACPQCKKVIDLDSKKSLAQSTIAKNPVFMENQERKANSQNEEQKNISEPVVERQESKSSFPTSSDYREIDYSTLKDPEPEEPTLQQRLEAMVEKKHKDEEKAKEPPSSSSECLHYFGYLHQREVGQPMPEECVVCTKSIECLMSNSNKSKESLKEIKKWYTI
jgi:hypothetical protein